MHRSHPSISRRKHLMKEMMEDDYALPTEQQQIVRVVSSRGNNLHEVETAKSEAEENFLVSMPNKFRKSMWVKRGDFLLIEPIEEGDKVKAEICKILTTDHVKEYTKAGIWPDKFAKKPAQEEELPSQNQEDSDFEDDLTPNTNRPQESSEEEEDDEDTSSDED